MSKNMAKIRKPACVPDYLTMSLDEHSTDTEEEDEMEYQDTTYSIRNRDYDGRPFCCIPRGEGTFIAVDPTITRVPQQNAPSEAMTSKEPSDAAVDYTDLGPWKNFQIPENIEAKKIPPERHPSNVTKNMRPSPENIKVPPQMLQSYPHPTKPPQKLPPDLSRHTRPSPPNATFRITGDTRPRSVCPATQANVLNATRNISKIVHPNYTYSRTPPSSQTVNACPCMQIKIASNLQKLNASPGAHKTFPTATQRCPLATFSTHEDKQPIMDLRELAEHRKRAPRYYSTPETDDFLNQGTDQSSVWGQDLSSFQSAETSTPEDSSLGWSQGVRMDSFNVRKCMTPSPKNVKVAPRLIRSYPHLTPSSNRQSPNLTQYSKVVFPDSIGNQPRNYNLQCQNLVTDTFCSPQNRTDLRSQPTANVTYQVPKAKVKFDPRQYTYTQPQNDRSLNQMQNATFVHSRKKDDPAYLPPKCVPCSAYRSFPITQHPQPPRTFSTHEDQQPILNVKEVAEHRKKAPRYHSTPEREDFLNQGFQESSVWGQDLSSFMSVDSITVGNVIKYMTVSPQDVRGSPRQMQSCPGDFRRKISFPQSLTEYSYPSVSAEISTNLTHSAGPRQPTNVTHSADPRDAMNVTYKLNPKKVRNQTYSAEMERGLNQTYSVGTAKAANYTYSAQPEAAMNQTYTVAPVARNQTYSADMERGLNQTYSIGNTRAVNRTYSAQPEGAIMNQTYSVEPVPKVQTSTRATNCECPITDEAQNNANVVQNFNDLVEDPCSNQNIARTYVPRPSRNYLTYVEKIEK